MPAAQLLHRPYHWVDLTLLLTMAAATKKISSSQQRRSKELKQEHESKERDDLDHRKAFLAEEHLPPLFLVAVVLMCSGALFVLAMRDFVSTGKVIAGTWDEAMLVGVFSLR